MNKPEIDASSFDVRLALGVVGILREFNVVGVLGTADVHVARRLGQLVGEDDESVMLATALAVRAPRLGHVHVDLASIRDTATVEDESVDLTGLAWPSPSAWIERVAHSAMVSLGEEDAALSRPFRLIGTRLHLDRYWREERQIAADLQALGARRPARVRTDVLADGIARLFDGQTDSRQCLAAASAVLRRLAVVAGGPGTGKTTTVARIVALVAEQAAATASAAPLVALTAPTGKAAARLEEAVHDEATGLAVGDAIRDELLGLRASTLHRLLGWRSESHSRFRHHAGQRLPFDLVIVDETSMVSLSLMARLVDAVRPDARLILVGDPGQLASIEAGAVLGDIVGPAAEGLLMSAGTRAHLTRVTGHEVDARDPPPGATVAEAIIVLDRVHRFGGAIATVTEAIRRGDADAVIELLTDAPGAVTWIALDVGDAAQDALAPVRQRAVAAGRAVIAAARAGAAREAIEALQAFRVLCAHRQGQQGVATWTSYVESWLSEEIAGPGGTDRHWYVGRPVLVTRNDYELDLYNGDSGVVIMTGSDRVVAAFERHGKIIEVSPARLGAVDTVYAMTIHKSQGSQFDTAAVLLPAPTSPILTRELLYTAATRARRGLIIVGSEESIRTAVHRPVARASGLGWRLWRNGQPPPLPTPN